MEYDKNLNNCKYISKQCLLVYAIALLSYPTVIPAGTGVALKKDFLIIAAAMTNTKTATKITRTTPVVPLKKEEDSCWLEDDG